MATSRSRSTRFLWAAGLGWGYQLAAMITGLWLTKYLVVQLGDATMGWWTHSMVMVGYITAVDLGLSALLPREVAKQTGLAGSWMFASELPLVIGKWSKFALLQWPIAMVIAAICVVVMARNDESNSTAAAILMGIALLLYPFRIGSLVINGLQDFRYEGFAQIVSYFSGVIVTIVLCQYYQGPVAVIGGWLTQNLLAYTLVWSRLFVRYSSILPSVYQIQNAVTPFAMLGTGVWAWLSGIGVTLTGTAEILAIGWFTKETVLLNYSFTTRLVVIFTSIALTLGTAILPGLTEMRSSGDTKGMERATLAYAQIVLAISGFFGCLVLTLNPAFLEWWLGGDRYMGEFITLTAILGMNLRHFLNSVAITLFSLGLEKSLWKLTFANGIATVVLTFIFVRMGGPQLAALGPMCMMAILVPIEIAWVATKAPELSVKLLRSGLIWCVAYAAAAAVCYFVVRQFATPRLLTLTIAGCLSSLCYAMVILIPGLRSEALAAVQRLPMVAKWRKG